MKEIGIPDSDCLPHNLGNELCGCVTVPTYPQILENVPWSWRRCADEPSSAKKINHAGSSMPILQKSCKTAQSFLPGLHGYKLKEEKEK
jgi:hypothetical protein